MKIRLGCISSGVAFIISNITVCFFIKILFTTLPPAVPGEDDLGTGIAAIAIIFGSVIIGVVLFVVLGLVIFVVLWLKHKKNDYSLYGKVKVRHNNCPDSNRYKRLDL